MKEAMWKLDTSGEFIFSDATDPNQSVLFGDKPRYELLREQILRRFKGQQPTIEEIEHFVLAETAFRETHYKQHVLKQLEAEVPSSIQVISAPSNRRRGTFADPHIRVRFS
jgi:hypothetical protein